MQRKYFIVMTCVLVGCLATVFMVHLSLEKYREYKEEERIRNARIEVELAENLFTSAKEEVHISDFVTYINGSILNDEIVDTSCLGVKKVDFKFINDEDIEVPYSFEIEVKDTKGPFIWIQPDYYVTTSFVGTIEERVICVDDYDDDPVCKVEGEYDTKVPGSYKLNFHAHDAAGNETNTPFTLHVSYPTSGGYTYKPNPDYFTEMVKKFSKEEVLMGIDVSSWQGDIDFEKLKSAGVEFAIVRVGSKWGMDGEYFLDSKFERNMKGFNEVDIPVGAYFYSYARNEEEAKKDALYVIDKLKDYDVSLPIAFDFEDWSRYNSYHMSLNRLNNNAKAFIETLESAGYEGMLYGSVSYLNRMWDKDYETIWGAHYTTNANYKDVFKYWQFSSEGIVDGINGFVDLDVMYK